PTVSDVTVLAAAGVVEDGASYTGSFVGDDVDSDDDGASLTYTITAQPSEGTASVDAPDSTKFVFDPGHDFQDLAVGETRDVTFSYKATDSHATDSATAGTVTITVTGTNDAPTVSDVTVLAAAGVVEDGASYTGSFVGDDVDSD